MVELVGHLLDRLVAEDTTDEGDHDSHAHGPVEEASRAGPAGRPVGNRTLMSPYMASGTNAMAPSDTPHSAS